MVNNAVRDTAQSINLDVQHDVTVGYNRDFSTTEGEVSQNDELLLCQSSTITNELRSVLKTLSYNSYEIDVMKPNIASAITQLRLRRPVHGIPETWSTSPLPSEYSLSQSRSRSTTKVKRHKANRVGTRDPPINTTTIDGIIIDDEGNVLKHFQHLYHFINTIFGSIYFLKVRVCHLFNFIATNVGCCRQHIAEKMETMKYVVISAVLGSVFPATAAGQGTKASQPANTKFQEAAVQKTRLKFSLHMVVRTAAPSSAGTFANHRDFHTFGCPVFVLDPSLQQGQKIPKWKPRARQAIYLGHSPRHAQTVPIVLNLNTGLCSPQYHVVYDDYFTTTHCRETNELPQTWHDLFTHNRVNVLDGEPDIQASVKLSNEWQSESSVDTDTIPRQSSPTTEGIPEPDYTTAALPSDTNRVTPAPVQAASGIVTSPEGDETQLQASQPTPDEAAIRTNNRASQSPSTADAAHIPPAYRTTSEGDRARHEAGTSEGEHCEDTGMTL
jgi:hypothetical protein